MKKTRDINSNLKAVAALLTFCAFASATRATIIMGNTGTSGEIPAVTGNETGSFIFTNNADFLAVAISMSSDNDMSSGLASPTVTYNGDPLTEVDSTQRGDDGWVGIFYLDSPSIGGHTLSVSFDDALALDGGAWQIGALSLSNVDESNPIAGSATTITGGTGYTIPSSSTGLISEGDFLLVAVAADNVTGDPHMVIDTTLNGTILYDSNEPAGAGNRDYDAMYWALGEDDISGVDDDEVLLVNSGNSRVHAGIGVVFNAIPEPGTFALLTLAGLLAAVFRRRSVF
jgi:hypothetical protein